MTYQNILREKNPYQIMLRSLHLYEEHRHADIEVSYCAKGSFDIIIDKKTYHLSEGDMALVSPLASHEIPDTQDQNSLVLTLIMGSSLLRHNFSYFSKSRFKSPVCSLTDGKEDHKMIRKICNEIIKHYNKQSPTSNLIIQGSLYQLCGYLIGELSEAENEKAQGNKNLEKISKIEPALNLIYYDYKKNITVEEASNVTGYGKGNFCKIFKNIVGEAFHKALNRHRINVSLDFLTQTNLSIEEIAAEVGFSESKTFSRVFKQMMSETPGNYRKNNRGKSQNNF